MAEGYKETKRLQKASEVFLASLLWHTRTNRHSMGLKGSSIKTDHGNTHLEMDN